MKGSMHLHKCDKFPSYASNDACESQESHKLMKEYEQKKRKQIEKKKNTIDGSE